MNIFTRLSGLSPLGGILSATTNFIKVATPVSAFPKLQLNFSSAVALLQKENRNLLLRMHRTGPLKKIRPPRQPFGGAPFMKGVILKTLIKKPKKPNSANRKCVLVRLSSGKEMVAYVPGIGHNLQEHQIVLCRVGRLQDVPGVKIKCVRGKYDLGHVKV